MICSAYPCLYLFSAPVDGLEPVPYPAALVIYLGYESGGSGGGEGEGGRKTRKGITLHSSPYDPQISKSASR